jgi:4-diphosphocytidyl-2-C-methyl-D-erythritol kinase
LAKLTLSLRVTGVRGDGYHLLDSEMVTVSLADHLDFSAGDALEVVGDREIAGAMATDDSNLIRRALRAVGRRAHVRVHKRIPLGGGLGGGSADAAAVLRWAGVPDLSVAVSLGGDVPFCLVGGRARVRGIGEVIEVFPFEERTFTLLCPPLSVSTVAVYRVWDDLGGPAGAQQNDLEPAALAVEPSLAQWRDRLGTLTGQNPQLAGSGATWFVEGAFEGPGLVTVVTERPAV